jgi:hypothetical protein
MSKYLTASDLLAGLLGEEEDVEVEGLGTIRIRPLGMPEAMRIGSASKDDAEKFVQLLARALVEPKLTEEQIERLYYATADKLTPIIDRITAMGGKAPEVSDPLVGAGS